MSCQKDQNVDMIPAKSTLKTDTANTSGNFLAVSGTLNITIGDSTYTFDASRDSVAFINTHIDSTKYFGITAINKEHTMSFGISSSGSANANISGPIAGGQLLFSAENKRGLQYTLAKTTDPKDISKISLVKYMQDSVLTKGTFVTLMTRGGKPDAYKVQGSFNLLIK
ncbi:MAG TPA: hypothetical protein VL490_10535 [Mucilaginibacter sp.]|nr:hypothetical protein [Mucilaginibacter sp.]